MEETEKFKNKREFERKFPSKIFICSRCGEWIGDKDFCRFCGETSNKLFATENLYRYQIADEEPKIIFKPLEKLKEKDGEKQWATKENKKNVNKR